MAVLKGQLHTALLEVEAELEEIRERIFTIRVDGYPLRALGVGVDRVKADGDSAFDVATDCVERQARPLAGFLVLWTVGVMPGAFWAGSVGLEGISAAVDEEVKVIRHHAGGRFEAKIRHSLLPEVRWTTTLLHVGDETMRVFCHMDRRVVVAN
jgi:hypothetical protein